MTDTRFSPVDAPEREAVKEPPKRWRNWWNAGPGYCINCDTFTPGGVFSSTCCGIDGPFPTKDFAETKASEWACDPDVASFSEYLGAFPDGERP